MHPGVVDRVAGRVRGLGLVHRQVRVAEQLLGRAGLGRGSCGDPDAGRDVDLLRAELEGKEQGRLDALGEGRRVRSVRRVLDQDRELVPAEPGHGVAGAYLSAKAAGHLHEELVPAAVSQGVVDLLEPVEVEEQHGDAVVRAPSREGVSEPVPEESPVGQPRQRVVERLVQELCLQGRPVGDVAAVQHQPVDVRVVQQVGDGQLHVASPTGRVPPRGAQGVHAHRFRGGVRQGLEEAGGVGGRHQVAQGRALELARMEAEQPLTGHALVADDPARVEDGHHVRAVLHQGGEALPARGHLDCALDDPLLEMRGQVAVLAQRQHLTRDEQDHDDGPQPGHEPVRVPRADDLDHGRGEREDHGGRGEERAEGLPEHLVVGDPRRSVGVLSAASRIRA